MLWPHAESPHGRLPILAHHRAAKVVEIRPQAHIPGVIIWWVACFAPAPLFHVQQGTNQRRRSTGEATPHIHVARRAYFTHGMSAALSWVPSQVVDVRSAQVLPRGLCRQREVAMVHRESKRKPQPQQCHLRRHETSVNGRPGRQLIPQMYD